VENPFHLWKSDLPTYVLRFLSAFFYANVERLAQGTECSVSNVVNTFPPFPAVENTSSNGKMTFKRRLSFAVPVGIFLALYTFGKAITKGAECIIILSSSTRFSTFHHWKTVFPFMKMNLQRLMKFYLTKRVASFQLLLIPLLRLNLPTEGFTWDDLRKIFRGCQRMAKVPNDRNIAKNFNQLSRVHERYRQKTDTDGLAARAYSIQRP